MVILKKNRVNKKSGRRPEASRDPEGLGAQMLILTAGTTGGVVEAGPVLKVKTALATSRGLDLDTMTGGNGPGDVLKVINDDPLRDAELPGQAV